MQESYGFWLIVILTMICVCLFIMKKWQSRSGENKIRAEIIEVVQEQVPSNYEAAIEVYPKMFDADISNTYEELTVDAGVRKEIQPLIKQAAEVFLQGGIRKREIVVVLKPELLKGLKEGALEMVPAKEGGVRLIVRDVANKRIAGHGALKEINKIDVKKLAAGAFNLLTVIVGQAHLADINRQLTKITTLVKQIQQFLEDERNGRIRYCIEDMKDIYTIIYGGVYLSSEVATYLSKIEDTDRVCGEIMQSIECGWEKPRINISEKKIPYWTMENEHNDVKTEIANFQDDIGFPYLMCVQVRTIAAQLRMALKIDGEFLPADLSEKRLTKMTDAVENYRKEQIAFLATAKGWNQNMAKELPVWTAPQTQKKYCDSIDGKIRETENDLNVKIIQVNEVLSFCKKKMRETTLALERPLTMELTIGTDGEIQAMRKLNMSPSGKG